LGEQLVAQLPRECVQTIKGSVGHCFCRAGGLFQAVYVIQEGSVKTDYVLANGQYQILQFLYPGDFFGSDGVASGFYCFDRMALTDTIVQRIAFAALHQQMAINPSVQRLYEQVVSQDIVHTQDHVFSLGKHSTEQKLAFFLLDFQDRHPSYSKTLRLPMGREDLSSYLGVTIESLSRAFSFLERN
jgi:CRP/FNR family transcriptional regulator